MAEEKVKYKIEIDREQLVQELEEVRNQIDLSMGSAAYQGMQTPQGSDLIMPGGMANLPPTPISDPSGFTKKMEEGFWSNFSQTASSGWEGVTGSLEQAAGTLEIGAQKFKGDVRRMGLLTDPKYPEFGPRYLNETPKAREGLFWGTAGTVAPGLTGYNPDTLGMNISDYRLQSARSAGESASEFATN
jgi:hypothetical protein